MPSARMRPVKSRLDPRIWLRWVVVKLSSGGAAAVVDVIRACSTDEVCASCTNVAATPACGPTADRRDQLEWEYLQQPRSCLAGWRRKRHEWPTHPRYRQ